MWQGLTRVPVGSPVRFDGSGLIEVSNVVSKQASRVAEGNRREFQ